MKRISRPERRQLLGLLTLDELSDILDEAPTDSAAAITRELAPGDAADALDEIDTHTVADILQELSQEHADAIMTELDRPQDVAPLLQYPADSAGGIMTPDFPQVHYDDTAAMALDALRLFVEDAAGFGWVCVLDQDQRLAGYVSIARLALARPLRSVGELAEQYDQRLVSATPTTDQEEAKRIMSRYTLSFLPVVDEEQRVLGIIQAEEMMHVAEEEATEDMLRIASAPGERIFGSLGLSIRNRLPWLVLNLGTVLVPPPRSVCSSPQLRQSRCWPHFCPLWPGRAASPARKLSPWSSEVWPSVKCRSMAECGYWERNCYWGFPRPGAGRYRRSVGLPL